MTVSTYISEYSDFVRYYSEISDLSDFVRNYSKILESSDGVRFCPKRPIPPNRTNPPLRALSLSVARLLFSLFLSSKSIFCATLWATMLTCFYCLFSICLNSTEVLYRCRVGLEPVAEHETIPVVARWLSWKGQCRGFCTVWKDFHSD